MILIIIIIGRLARGERALADAGVPLVRLLRDQVFSEHRLHRGLRLRLGGLPQDKTQSLEINNML